MGGILNAASIRRLASVAGSRGYCRASVSSGEDTMTKGKEPPKTPRLRSILERHPKYAQAIGIISAEVAVLDVVLGELLAALLHIGPGFGRTKTAGMVSPRPASAS